MSASNDITAEIARSIKDNDNGFPEAIFQKTESGYGWFCTNKPSGTGQKDKCWYGKYFTDGTLAKDWKRIAKIKLNNGSVVRRYMLKPGRGKITADKKALVFPEEVEVITDMEGNSVLNWDESTFITTPEDCKYF